MSFLKMFLFIYLAIGVIYGIHLLIIERSSIWGFPINVLFGPIYIPYAFYKVKTKKSIAEGYYNLHDIMKKKKAVLFDLDGTVVDTMPLWGEAFNNVLSKFSDIGVDFLRKSTGNNLIQVWKEVLEERALNPDIPTEELVLQTKKEFIKLVKERGVPIREGFVDLVTFLKKDEKYKLGLVSNSKRAVVNTVLKRTDLEGFFDVEIAGDEVQKTKPDPEMYNVAIKKLGVNKKEVLVFEDSISGAQAAASAELDMIIIWDGTHDIRLYPKEFITYQPNFVGLEDAMERDLFEEAKEYANKEQPQS